ncbi:MAG: exodeoxyribonuclease V subunit alpha [Pseudonocardiales bacterium]
MTVDLFDVGYAARAGGRLAAFNQAGVLSAADVHVATTLGRLGSEGDDRVLLAVALAVRAVRLGSVCIDLGEVHKTAASDTEESVDPVDLPWPSVVEWYAACRNSPLVAVGVSGAADGPVRLVEELIYLDRYWRQEQLVRTELDARAALSLAGVDPARLRAALSRLFPSEAPDYQRLAAAACVTGAVTVVAGGPGTGKTSTVARLLAVLHELFDGPLRVALAAPTGKAAARLQEAIAAVSAGLAEQDRAALGTPTASTVHRLLGWRPDSHSRFKYNRSNRLPFDVVLIDETSMVSLTLMSRLLEAIRPDARLVLVGDPDQLASVEAGAVLGDLVGRPPRPGVDARLTALTSLVPADLVPAAEVEAELRNDVVRLRKPHRFGGAIAELAEAIRLNRPDEVLAVLRGGDAAIEFVDSGDVSARAPAGLEGLRADVVHAGLAMTLAARAGDSAAALGELERHRLVCAHRRGPYGVARWSDQIEHWLAAVIDGYAAEGEWYRGRPLLVTANDYELKIYNGDTGVVVDGGGGEPVAAFGGRAEPLLLSPSRLSGIQTVHAMTVHRGQGSQFDRVSVLLPPEDSPLLTRELFYTAVTRAETFVRVIGTEEAVKLAVTRPVVRASGLRRSRALS